MAYSLNIERNPQITFEELLIVVKEIKDTKIIESDTVGINPKTKEEIRILGSKKGIALWFSELEEWIKVFHFARGRIVFKANGWDDPKSPVRSKAFELARKLNAEIIGDEGEIYTN